MSPWSIILADNPDVESLQMLAEDGTNEGRVRVLADGRLRSVVNVSGVLTIDRGSLTQKLRSVPALVLHQVEEGLRLVLGL